MLPFKLPFIIKGEHSFVNRIITFNLGGYTVDLAEEVCYSYKENYRENRSCCSTTSIPSKNSKTISSAWKALSPSCWTAPSRPDSDIDAVIVVTEEKFAQLAAQNRLAEVIPGHCTYEGGYFDIKYKTKAILQQSALHASEPTRNAYVKAQVIHTTDAEIEQIVPRISTYPEHEAKDKIACFNANLQLNRSYFLQCVPESNAYMRAHLADEIVYSVYRLILIENRMLFPCNRRLEETVEKCSRRPQDILRLGAKFLREITVENCEAFVQAFWKQTSLPLSEDVSENCSQYVKYYEDWWMRERAPFPNEW